MNGKVKKKKPEKYVTWIETDWNAHFQFLIHNQIIMKIREEKERKT